MNRQPRPHGRCLLAALAVLSMLPALPAAAQPDSVLEPPPPVAPAATAEDDEGGTRERQRNVHGLGLTLSYTQGAGLSYRRYLGDSAIQLTGMAIVADRGEEAWVSGSLSAIQYLIIWNRNRGRGLVPSVTALRLVESASVFYSSSVSTEWLPSTAPECGGVNAVCTRTVREKATRLGIGAGIGFEFGAIMRPGFSLALDLLLTAGFNDAEGKGMVLDFLVPLPGMTLMFSW